MSKTATRKSWYVASTGNHQGLIIDESDGRDVAVAYDKADAPLLAAAPALLAACEAWRTAFECGELERSDEPYTLTCAAIRQARGEQ